MKNVPVKYTNRHAAGPGSASQYVAFAAVSGALAALLLTAGYYLQLLEFFWYFMAALCLMLPLTRGYIRTAVFAYAVSVMLALVLCSFSFIFILPYVVFMGPHPIANALIKKYRVSAVLGHIVKVVWFNAAVFAMIRFTGLFFFIDLNAGGPTIPVIIAAGTTAYFLYDFAVRLVMSRLQKRLARFAPPG